VVFVYFLAMSFILPDGVLPGIPELVQGPDGSVSLEVPGACLEASPGLPALPVFPMSIPLSSVSGSGEPDFTSTWTTVAMGVHLAPVPEPVPLSMPARGLRALPPDVWLSDNWWPAAPVRVTGIGRTASGSVLDIVVCPYRYNPVSGLLERMESLDLGSPPPERDTPAVPGRMLIVTADSLADAFIPLAQRRFDEGIVTSIVPMSQVAAWPGRDDAEKLRNYVIQFRLEHGLDYLLLGGDTNLVPYRKAYAMTCEAGFHPREDSLPCDLYFADLDGDWDADGDAVFGELADGVDLYPDISVGRAPVENLAEAASFVAKTAAIEDGLPSADFIDRGLLAAMELWDDPYTDSGVSKDYILASCIPPGMDVTRLYESLGNEDAEAVIAALEAGTSFVNHCGHAWFGSIGTGPDYISCDMIDSVDSGGRFASFLYSTGCWSAAFDFDAIAEHFVTDPDGCGACWIGNSSYGWGSPGNPLYGYSDRFDQEFNDVFFGNPSLRMGEALAQAKQYFVPLSRDENVYRWHQYDLNLLGDPSFLPPRGIPAEPVLCLPPFVTPSTTSISITVLGCVPEGLVLCVHDDGGNYFVRELDASGQEFISFDQPPDGPVTVTVTGPGARRASEQIDQETGPLLTISQVDVIEPGQTSPDGHLSPGEQDILAITVGNSGTEPTGQVALTAFLQSGPALLLDDAIYYGSLAPGESSSGSDSLRIAVSTAASFGQIVTLHLQLQWDGGMAGCELPLLVSSPGLYLASWSVDDSSWGDADGAADPGEAFDLLVHIANFGLETASDATIEPAALPSWLSLSQVGALPAIPQDGVGDALFSATLSQEAPSPSFTGIGFLLGSGFWSGLDSLVFSAGTTGLSTDVESGDDGWTSSGSGDLWVITSTQHHSGNSSWHCGHDPGYDPGMDCGLGSPSFTAGPGPDLSFWARYETAIYGVDGLYLILHPAGGEPDTLDFIGSGGALGPVRAGVGADWTPFAYDLPLDPGDSAWVEFRFVSDLDAETDDGFFLDDMTVAGGWEGFPGQPGGSGEPAPLLGMPFPSPCRGLLRFELSLPSAGAWQIGIVDLAGRTVSSQGIPGPGRGLLAMDLSDMPDGLYFLVLTGPQRATGSFVLLRGQ
jgi:hypothetical protein